MYLCGKPNADTRDHIPPRGIFPNNPNGQLLTVPAHRSCNEKYSDDDELLRNLIMAASHRTPKGKKAWDDQVVPSWKENPGAKQKLQERMMVVWVKDPISGILIEQKILAGDVSLFEREVDRWTRGLFYKKFNEPLSPSLPVHIEKLEYPEISIPPLNNLMIKNGVRPNWVHIELNIFSYFYAVANENRNVGTAVFVFFNTEVYMASTGVY